jgi:hypothetical protein
MRATRADGPPSAARARPVAAALWPASGRGGRENTGVSWMSGRNRTLDNAFAFRKELRNNIGFVVYSA